MKIVVGLGNPGREYAATRHNLGFMVVDEIARRLSASDRRSRFRAELAETFDDGEKIVLVKPQTYMNLSGTSVREVAHWYKVSPDDILVVADDIDLPFGTLRMRAGGSSGGHNGLKSIFAELDTQDVSRLRLGVGRGGGHATRQVLTRFSPQEAQELPAIVRTAADCVLDWKRHGVVNAMNRCNRRLASAVDTSTSAQAVTKVASSPERATAATTPAVPRLVGAYNRARAWWKGQDVDAGGSQRDPDR
ncbi:MAG: aminoacyl-tRNA hydrolase [Thermomicrobiales bacterium]